MDLLAAPLAVAIMFSGIELPPLPSSEATIRVVRQSSWSDRRCRDRLIPADNSSGGAHRLFHATASPEKPHLLYALDMRVNGCNVMVVKSGTNRIRPLSSLPKEEPRIVPLRESK